MSAERRGSLGVLLGSGEAGVASRGAVSACADAMGSGAEAYLYLLHDGVHHVHEPAFQQLRDRGLRLFCCAFGARRRGIEPDDAAIYCGLGVLSDIVASVDRFLCFTGSPWDGQTGEADRVAPGRARRRIQIRAISNPDLTDLPAEGVRVAVGLLASGRVDVGLAFGGAARRCVAPGAENLRDGRDMVMHLESFRGGGGEVRLDAGRDASVTGWFSVLGF